MGVVLCYAEFSSADGSVAFGFLLQTKVYLFWQKEKGESLGFYL